MRSQELKGITVAHALPGRVRLKISRIKENPELARQAQERLSQVPGIQGVEANPATGSLLILYDLSLLASLEALGPLAQILAELFPELEVDSLAASLSDLAVPVVTASTNCALTDAIKAVGQPASSLSPSLNVNLLLPLTLLFLGGRSLFTSKEVSFPAWYDYLWFAFSTFVMLNRRWVEGKPESAAVL